MREPDTSSTAGSLHVAGGRGSFPFHPLLIAAFPVLAMYSANTGEARVTDVGVVLLVVLAGSGLALLLLRRVLQSADRAALATTLLVVLAFAYTHLNEVAVRLQGIDPLPARTRYWLMGWLGVTVLVWGLRSGRVLGSRQARVAGASLYLALLLLVTFRLSFLWAWLLLAAGLLWYMRFTARDFRRTTGPLNVGSVLLVFTSLAASSTAWAKAATSPVAAAGEAMTTDWSDRLVLDVPSRPPDIYFLVFDRYGSSRTLSEHFGYDNSHFTEQLAERGFFVADGSHANYPKTIMSIAAALNMEYLGDEYVRPNNEYAEELENHRVGRLLKRIGYRYHYVGNWALRRDPQADSNFRVSPLPSEFAQVVYERLPVSAMFMQHSRMDRTRTLRKFKWLHRLPTAPGPKLVYAHFLVPHPPFRFNRTGGPATPGQPYERQYLDQLIFTNGKIIEMVDSILARSATPPIIVVQADEGPRLTAADEGKPRRSLMDKRTGILSAFHLPGVSAEDVVPTTISPVNTFRLILSEYFDAGLELLDDRIFYWERSTPEGTPDTSEPCRIIDVTAEILMQQPAMELTAG